MIVIRRYGRIAYRGVLKKLPLSLRRRILFLRHRRRWLRLNDPVTFSEKVNWRMVYDRRPLLGMACDKDAAKSSVASRGISVARTLWRGTDLGDLAANWSYGDDQEWVLKPNFSSGDILFGRGRPDAHALSGIAASWLSADRSETGEWGYSQADRVLLLEERLGEEDTAITDYKFFVCDGRVLTVRVLQVGTKARTGVRYYNPDGSPSRFVDPIVPLAPQEDLPSSWSQMVSIASLLGAEFDFVRVDLYDVGGEVFFGELTVYPGGGLNPRGKEFEEQMGKAWELPAKTG